MVGRDLSTSLVIKSGPGDFLFFEVEIAVTVVISSSVISGSGSRRFAFKFVPTFSVLWLVCPLLVHDCVIFI